MGGLRGQVIVVVALLLVVPLLVMLYDLRAASRSDDVLVRDLEARLTQVATGLAGEMEARWGGGPLEDVPGVFRGVAAPLAAGNPGTRLGLYVVDTGQLFVEGFLHEYRELTPEEQEEREHRILREAAAGIASVLAGGQPLTRVGQTWDDQFLEALVPVRAGGRTVAVTWAEQRLHPAFAERARTRLVLRYAALGTLGVGLVFTMWAVLNFAGQVRRIKEGLGALERDLGHVLPEMPGEMGEIAAAINKMAAGLAEKERQLEQFRRSENLVALG
ncbi:MAG: two-component sensor histidine kinase, partial [Firmicutes bacterium]|nr:two-component sensor histidine kinase [Bacillota bacterium]